MNNKTFMVAKLEDWLDTLNYWYEHIEEYGERYPDMLPMIQKFSNLIDEMFELTKEYRNA